MGVVDNGEFAINYRPIKAYAVTGLLVALWAKEGSRLAGLSGI